MRIYFDLPGMGKTPGASWIKNSDNMAQHISIFVDAILPETSFAIVGYSYGGYLGAVNRRARDQRMSMGCCSIGLWSYRIVSKEILHQARVLRKDEKNLETFDPETRQLLYLSVLVAR